MNAYQRGGISCPLLAVGLQYNPFTFYFMDLIQQLNWRYATQNFDSTKKVAPEKLALLLETLRLAPSSYGLQPWKFVLVENPELRAKLQAASWGQAKVTEASHLLVLCRLEKMGEAEVLHFVEENAKIREQDPASMEGFKQMLLGFASQMTPESYAIWASKQVYLALGMLLSACAMESVDAGPMEGFDSAQYDAILDLPSKGLRSVVVCALGYRSADDKYAHAKKVRFPKDEVTLTL